MSLPACLWRASWLHANNAPRMVLCHMFLAICFWPSVFGQVFFGQVFFGHGFCDRWVAPLARYALSFTSVSGRSLPAAVSVCHLPFASSYWITSV